MSSVASASTRFDQILSSPALLEVLRELEFQTPTPIQAQAIPLVMEGKDVIAQAETGSGKTAAFALPILERLELGSRRKLQALILCPTRELGAQVAREMRRLGRRIPGLQVLEIAGGAPIGPQWSALERGVHVVVGTPGRVIDHLERRSLDLRGVRTLVLDEADRMLDMGFEESLTRILEDCPAHRQTVLFSATFPKTIEALSRRCQKNPVRLTIEKSAPIEAGAVSSGIEEVLYTVDSEQRLKALLYVLGVHPSQNAIVFVNFKATAKALGEELVQWGVSAAELHGDLEQFERDQVMAKFRNGSVRVLIATDVAARGIDVPQLGLVVNFEAPVQPEDYVHRIGRTGRAGEKGVAITFLSEKERPKLDRLRATTATQIREEKSPDWEEFSADELADKTRYRSEMRTLLISGGRKDKVRPGDLLGALTGEAGGFEGSDVGKIEIHDRYAYVAVRSDLAEEALYCLQEGRIKGRRFRVALV